MDAAALQSFYAGVTNPSRLPKALNHTLFAAGQTSAVDSPYIADAGNAFIPITGAISKYASGDDECETTSTMQVQAAITAELDDASVKSIVLYIDAPGGTVAGTCDLADFIFAAKAKKPIVAYISDNCMSAAYWLASQCTKVIANAGAFIRSIGVYQVLLDSSEAAKASGMVITLVSDGEYKGLGAPGIAVEQKDVDETKRRVKAASDLFIDSVARGRKMTPAVARSLADGRVYVASEALKLGLIDSIGVMADAIAKPATSASVLQALNGLSQSLASLASATPAKPKRNPVKSAVERDRLRLVAINAILGDGNSEFATRAWEAGMSAEQAKVAHDNAIRQDAIDARNPETVWNTNRDGVQASYRNNKKYFLADWNHKAKSKCDENRRQIVKNLSN